MLTNNFRDQLDEKTIDFEYVELINIRNIDGDVFVGYFISTLHFLILGI